MGDYGWALLWCWWLAPYSKPKRRMTDAEWHEELGF